MFLLLKYQKLLTFLVNNPKKKLSRFSPCFHIWNHPYMRAIEYHLFWNKGQNGANLGLFWILYVRQVSCKPSTQLHYAKKFWECCDKVVRNLWKVAKEMGKRSEKTVRKFWENFAKVVRNGLESCENVARKLWESCEKIVRKLWESC